MPPQTNPLGVSNQAATALPGTQQTAIKKAAGQGISPTMPVGPQLARQQASAYQRSVGGGAASPGLPVAPTGGARPMRAGAMAAGRPAVSTPRGGGGIVPRSMQQAGPTTGYSMLAGVPNDQLRQMSSDLGISHLSRLPSTDDAFRTPTVADARPGLARQARGDMLARRGGGFDPDVTTKERSSFLGDAWDWAIETQADVGSAIATGGLSTILEDDDDGGAEFTDAEVRAVETKSWNEYVAESGYSPLSPEEVAAKSQASTPEQEHIAEAYGMTKKVSEIWEEGEDIGYDEQKLQGVKDDLATVAEQSYQNALQGLSRQMAMAGMTGSGAHIVANNALASQVYGQLLEEYAQLDMANLQQIEIDLNEQITNGLSIAEQYRVEAATGTQISASQTKEAIDKMSAVDTQIAQPFLNFLDLHGYEMSGSIGTEFWKLYGEAMEAMSQEGVNMAMVAAYYDGELAKLLEAIQASPDPYGNIITA